MQEREPKLTALDKSIRRSLSDSAAGRVKPAEEVFNRLEEKYRAMANVEAEADPS